MSMRWIVGIGIALALSGQAGGKNASPPASGT